MKIFCDCFHLSLNRNKNIKSCEQKANKLRNMSVEKIWLDSLTVENWFVFKFLKNLTFPKSPFSDANYGVTQLKVLYALNYFVYNNKYDM